MSSFRDYILFRESRNIVVQGKDIQELIGDICGKSHVRFRDECIRAQESGISLG